MTQYAAVFSGKITTQIELPGADEEAIPGVNWGAIDAFPSPAYWAYQVVARRINGQTIRSRLGRSLREEVAACILGGHGIPASVGVASFQRLQDRKILESQPTESELFEQLREPLMVNGRWIRYRFARQKAKYLSEALRELDLQSPAVECGRELRDRLLKLSGVGFKTASWITRNWLDADDVAILDIHIMRAGRLAGFLAADLTVESDYLELETQFLRFSQAIGVRPSELDAVIWFEMASSPSAVRQLLEPSHLNESGRRSRRPAHIRRPNSDQTRSID